MFVIGGPSDLGIGHEGGQVAGRARVGQHLEVEVGERDDGTDAMLGAQRLQRRHVLRVVDPRHRDPVVGRVLRGGERVRIRRHHRRVLSEGRDDVVALPDPGQEHGYSGACHPPFSPL